MAADPSFWKRCSNCKKELPFAATYWACNVSTCNRPRTALVFCSVPCWDAHVPTLRHRDAWAEERTPRPRRTGAASSGRRRGRSAGVWIAFVVAPARERRVPGAAGVRPPGAAARAYTVRSAAPITPAESPSRFGAIGVVSSSLKT